MTTSTMTSSPWENPPFSPSPALPELERKSLSRVQRLLLIAAIILGVIVLLVSVICTIAAWIFAHPSVPALASNPMSARNLMYEDVRFDSADRSSELQGWWIPAAGDRTIVLSHGYGTNREEDWVPMYDIANLLHEQDYNVLMFDYGFADSTNRMPATGGVTESQQLLGALQFARDKGSGEVIVWGFSMGAGTALQAALQSDLIDGMILDSTFLPDADSIYANIRKYADVPKPLTVSLINRFLPIFTGTQLNQIPSTAAQTTDYSFPILLIYGTNDDKSPISISENIAASQTNPLSELWVVPGALHEMIFRMHPEEYVARTTAFLQSIEQQRA